MVLNLTDGVAPLDNPILGIDGGRSVGGLVKNPPIWERVMRVHGFRISPEQEILKSKERNQCIGKARMTTSTSSFGQKKRSKQKGSTDYTNKGKTKDKLEETVFRSRGPRMRVRRLPYGRPSGQVEQRG